MSSDENEVAEDACADTEREVYVPEDTYVCGEEEQEGEVDDVPKSLQAKLKPENSTDRPPSSGNQLTKSTTRKRRPPPAIRINLANCKYDVLRNVQRKLGWKEVGDEDDWEVYWTDMSVGVERIMKLNKTQKINHFNGMLELCRKKSMARNISKMSKMFPAHYDFMPKTFSLPIDMQDLLNDVRVRGKKQIYILKPDAGCQGKGIRLVQGGKEEKMSAAIKDMDVPNAVAQHYLPKPLLVNGFKFDMRIYALVLSCDPLRVFIYREGLTRICTEKYTKPKADNLSLTYMHLTNYAVNKHNESFQAGKSNVQAEAEAAASKWTLGQLSNYLEAQGYEWSTIWERVQHLIVKSLISVQPIVRNNYRSMLPPDNDGFSCFEILGYDVMLDDDLRPWLLEVNHSPSFCIDSPLDQSIKEQLIMDTLELARIDPRLISKAKKAEKKATAGRLLEPLQKRKPPTNAPGSANASGQGSTNTPGSSNSGVASTPAQSSQPSDDASCQSKDGASATGAAAPPASTTSSSSKSKTPEEYEAMRQQVLAKREKYEAKHMGGYTRIYPSANPELQETYETLLKGANEVFQSSFQAKAKKMLDAMGEERKRKQEETESDSVKADKARARAHRDRLAQMALERRAKKAEVKAEADAVASQTPPAQMGTYSTYLMQGEPSYQQLMAVGQQQQQQQPHPTVTGPYLPSYNAIQQQMMQQYQARQSADSGPPYPGVIMGTKSLAGLNLWSRVSSFAGGSRGGSPKREGDNNTASTQQPQADGRSEYVPSNLNGGGSRPISGRQKENGHRQGDGATSISSILPGPPQHQHPAHPQRYQQQHPQLQQQQQQPPMGPAHPSQSGPDSQGLYTPQPIWNHNRQSWDIVYASSQPSTDGGPSGLNLQPGSLSSGPTSRNHGQRGQDRHPQHMHHSQQQQPQFAVHPQHTHHPQQYTTPGIGGPLRPGSLASVSGSGRHSPSRIPSANANTPGSMKAVLPGWGGREDRMLPINYLSPRAQVALRPESPKGARPSSSGSVIGMTRQSLSSFDGGLSLMDKLQPNAGTLPMNPAFAVADPSGLQGIVGSPVAASSLLHSHSRRGKRTLSAPMRDSMKRAEGSNNQQDQQQAVHQQQLEYKLLQLQQQQAQQAQQADAHHENNGITGPSDHRPSTPPTHPRPPLHPRNSGPAPHAPLSPMHQQQPHTQQPPSIPTCLPLHTFPPVRPPSPSLNNPQSAPTLYTFLEESLSPTLHPLQQANAVHSSPQQHPTAPSLPGAGGGPYSSGLAPSYRQLRPPSASNNNNNEDHRQAGNASMPPPLKASPSAKGLQGVSGIPMASAQHQYPKARGSLDSGQGHQYPYPYQGVQQQPMYSMMKPGAYELGAIPGISGSSLGPSTSTNERGLRVRSNKSGSGAVGGDSLSVMGFKVTR